MTLGFIQEALVPIESRLFKTFKLNLVIMIIQQHKCYPTILQPTTTTSVTSVLWTDQITSRQSTESTYKLKKEGIQSETRTCRCKGNRQISVEVMEKSH